ncbi:unnamed protein product [Prorocentrum cordatum]|uniref:KHDC4/BBP-like KH-domain type I domain-containing protein n=1 Tax=Prorocentrum cordatum TaxID=2364126 RepID=A0ABN9QFH3_9DINO|nr:unnamed protein product [Polarella glacialis]
MVSVGLQSWKQFRCCNVCRNVGSEGLEVKQNAGFSSCSAQGALAGPWGRQETTRKNGSRGRGPDLCGATSGTHRDVGGLGVQQVPQQQQRLQKLPSGRSKLWCHFYLDEGMLVKGFDLAKKIIGHAGAGTRSIFDATGAKIRFRGKGSCHLEGRYEREAPVHLMLAVTADLEEVDGFREAVRLAAGHLRSVEDRFCHFCGRSGRPSPRPGACFWVGEISARGAACSEGVLGDLGLVVPAHP